MSQKDNIIATTEGILDALRALTGRLYDALERYREDDDVESLGEEIEDQVDYMIPDVATVMKDLALDISLEAVETLED